MEEKEYLGSVNVRVVKLDTYLPIQYNLKGLIAADVKEIMQLEKDLLKKLNQQPQKSIEHGRT